MENFDYFSSRIAYVKLLFPYDINIEKLTVLAS